MLAFMGPIVVYGSNMLFQDFSALFVAAKYFMSHYGIADTDKKQVAASVMNSIFFIFGRTIFLVYCSLIMMGPFWIKALFIEVNSPAYKAFITEMIAAIMLNISLNVAQSWIIVKQLRYV